MVRERAGRRVTLLRAFIKAESSERTISGDLSQRGNSTRGATLEVSNTACLIIIIAEKRGKCKRLATTQPIAATVRASARHCAYLLPMIKRYHPESEGEKIVYEKALFVYNERGARSHWQKPPLWKIKLSIQGRF